MPPRLFIPATRLIKSTIQAGSVSSSRLNVCTASRIRLRRAARGRVRLRMQMRAFPGMCEFMHAVRWSAGRSYVPGTGGEGGERGGGHTPGHLARLDCNRRCICTYVRPWLYGGWHATGVCRARQLIKPTSKRCRPTAPYPALTSLSPLLAVPWTIYTGICHAPSPLGEADLYFGCVTIPSLQNLFTHV